MVVCVKGLHIYNYRNVRAANLSDLGDLNIILGPNNSGKSNLLKCLQMSNLTLTAQPFVNCEKCETIRHSLGDLASFFTVHASFAEDDHRNHDYFPQISYDFEEKVVIYHWLTLQRAHVRDILEDSGIEKEEREHIVGLIHEGMCRFLDDIPDAAIEKVRDFYSHRFLSKLEESEKGKGVTPHLSDSIKNSIYHMDLTRVEGDEVAVSTHISMLLEDLRRRSSTAKSVFGSMHSSILTCEDDRLNVYKGTPIVEYVSSQRLSVTELGSFRRFLRKIVDPQIRDVRIPTWHLVFSEFEDAIAHQGSGVRSVICLAADILGTKEGSIIIIDEPELGLHPSAKHSFLDFLLDEAKRKQVFLATHDPTFVSPVLWKDNSVRVEVFLYSLVSDKFLKLDMDTICGGQGAFAGVLPQTHSSKRIHIYVEGIKDIYLFDVFLRRFMKENGGVEWYKKFNQIGLFHLGGDMWKHLLYTIPTSPYRCSVILDGDKLPLAEKVLLEYDNAVRKLPSFSVFSLCKSPRRVGDLMKEERVHPVYCLRKPRIEKYIVPEGRVPPLPDLMKLAMSLPKLPREIKDLFVSIIA